MIVWDLGGVVARFEPGERLLALAHATRMPPQQVDQAIWGSGLDAAAERGLFDDDTCWSKTLAALDHRIDRIQLRRCWAEAFVPDPAVTALIDGFRHPCALFTDNGPILEACLGHELAPLSTRFEHLLLSWRLQAIKSNPTAYHRAARILDTPPAALTLIDDRMGNVAAARQAGWTAIHFASIEDLASLL